MLRRNLEALDSAVYAIAITAPGVEQLPWGPDGRVEAHALTRWNRTATRRWSQLHNSAAAAVRREAGRFSLVGYTWEFQARGALHLHVILRAGTALERHQAHLYVKALDRLRHQHRFGFVDRGRAHGGARRLERISARRAGAYLAKYLAPMNDGKMSLSETATREDAPSRLFFMSRSLTMATGQTMRNLRYKRAAWMRLRELGLEDQVDDVMSDPHNWRIIATGTYSARAP